MGIVKKLKNGLDYISTVIGRGSLVASISMLYEQDLGRIGVDITGYGFPFSWLKKGSVVYPDSPIKYSFHPENLVLNILFWSGAIEVAYRIGKTLYNKYKTENNFPKPNL